MLENFLDITLPQTVSDGTFCIDGKVAGFGKAVDKSGRTGSGHVRAKVRSQKAEERLTGWPFGFRTY